MFSFQAFVQNREKRNPGESSVSGDGTDSSAASCPPALSALPQFAPKENHAEIPPSHLPVRHYQVTSHKEHESQPLGFQDNMLLQGPAPCDLQWKELWALCPQADG